LDARTVEGVLDDVGRVGAALAREGEAVAAVVGLRERMFAASEFVNPFDEGAGVLFLESAGPLRVPGWWVPQLIERAGGRPLLNATSARPGSGAAIGPQMAERVAGPTVAVSEEAAAQAVPDWVVVAGPDLAGARRLVSELRGRAWFRVTPAARNGRVVAVDGRVFLRPGPRIVEGFELLVAVLNDRPAAAPVGVAWEVG
jgi:iron complex transport system substrate-binding protein